MDASKAYARITASSKRWTTLPIRKSFAGRNPPSPGEESKRLQEPAFVLVGQLVERPRELEEFHAQIRMTAKLFELGLLVIGKPSFFKLVFV